MQFVTSEEWMAVRKEVLGMTKYEEGHTKEKSWA